MAAFFKSFLMLWISLVLLIPSTMEGTDQPEIIKPNKNDKWLLHSGLVQINSKELYLQQTECKHAANPSNKSSVLVLWPLILLLAITAGISSCSEDSDSFLTTFHSQSKRVLLLVPPRQYGDWESEGDPGSLQVTTKARKDFIFGKDIVPKQIKSLMQPEKLNQLGSEQNDSTGLSPCFSSGKAQTDKHLR